jgi:hypothetical protein
MSIRTNRVAKQSRITTKFVQAEAFADPTLIKKISPLAKKHNQTHHRSNKQHSLSLFIFLYLLQKKILI